MIGRMALAMMFLGTLGIDVAEAQMGYPRGYGRYGMSRWGADPGAGYMAALGAYGRAQGVYALDKAKADAINVETMQKWNAALRARQTQLAKDRADAQARRDAALRARVERRDDRDGTTLNEILLQIFDSDPGVVRSSRVATPLGPGTIQEIPFEWASEAITICLDQMTAQESIPALLADPVYEPDRAAVRAAMSRAMAEDAKGAVSAKTLERARAAVAKFRADFLKHASDYDPGHQEAKAYLTTLDALIRTFDDPSMRRFLELLEDGKERTVGDLIAFMQAFNLRFGPAESERQEEVYARLAPALAAVRDVAVAARTAPTTPDPNGDALRAAAAAAFQGMDWKELDAHERSR